MLLVIALVAPSPLWGFQERVGEIMRYEHEVAKVGLEATERLLKTEKWEKADTEEDGSYVTVSVPYGTAFAVYSVQDNSVPIWLILAIVAAAVLATFLIIKAIRRGKKRVEKRREKRKKKKQQQTDSQ